MAAFALPTGDAADINRWIVGADEEEPDEKTCGVSLLNIFHFIRSGKNGLEHDTGLGAQAFLADFRYLPGGLQARLWRIPSAVFPLSYLVRIKIETILAPGVLQKPARGSGFAGAIGPGDDDQFRFEGHDRLGLRMLAVRRRIFRKDTGVLGSRVDAGRFGANVLANQTHQLSKLFVGRLSLGVHEIEDFAGFVGHAAFNMRRNRGRDKSKGLQMSHRVPKRTAELSPAISFCTLQPSSALCAKPAPLRSSRGEGLNQDDGSLPHFQCEVMTSSVRAASSPARAKKLLLRRMGATRGGGKG